MGLDVIYRFEMWEGEGGVELVKRVFIKKIEKIKGWALRTPPIGLHEGFKYM